jgi:hypothetical protein
MSRLATLYSGILNRGNVPPNMEGSALPHVDVAQQQFVRYPGVQVAQECTEGWQRSQDALAGNFGRWVRFV